jgi:hypothetical protein
MRRGIAMSEGLLDKTNTVGATRNTAVGSKSPTQMKLGKLSMTRRRSRNRESAEESRAKDLDSGEKRRPMNATEISPRHLVAIVLGAGLTLFARQGERSVIAHTLVATPNEHSVPMYRDEETYMKVSRMKEQGGVDGLAGEVRKDFSAKDIDDRTPVMILSSEENGAVVEIAEGPMKGRMGFGARRKTSTSACRCMGVYRKKTHRWHTIQCLGRRSAYFGVLFLVPALPALSGEARR